MWIALGLLVAPSERAPRLIEVRPLTAHNAKAAATSQVPALLERGPATGLGVLIAQWDEGAVRASHVDLAGRARTRDGAELSEHATHIAGTLIGTGSIDPAARGMAPDAALWSYRWNWDALEERAAAPFIAASAHAYGVALGWAPAGEGCDDGATFFGGAAREDAAFGRYGRSAVALDRALHEADAVSVWAAGNERMDAGPAGDVAHFHYPDCTTERHDAHADEVSLQYGTLGGAITAKNAIAVGAVADIETEVLTPELIVPLSFSSFGPTDDGRIKPDLAASGETLYSASSSADDAYDVFGGTSSAAAIVAGGVALLSERYRVEHDGRDPSAAEVKAVLIHSAAEAGAHAGPDYALGYGLFDVAAATAAIERDDDSIRVGSLASERDLVLHTGEVPEATALRFTLAWLDPAGTEGDAALVNDLDLELIAPDGETRFHPWRLDPANPARAARRDAPNTVDTVERIDVPASDNTWQGAWTVRVRARDPLAGGHPQSFALVASASLERSPEPALGSTRRVLVRLAEGEAIADAPLTIDNLGDGSLTWSLATSAGWLELSASEGTAPSRPTLRIDASDLARGQQHLATVTLAASTERVAREIGVVVERACSGECVPPGEPACTTVDLASDLGPTVAHGRTDRSTGGPPAPSCGERSGASVVFTWRAPYDDVFELTLSEADERATLYVLEGVCEGAELACATGEQEHRATVDLEQGEQISVVVDAPDSRTFGLGIRAMRSDACTEDCDGGAPPLEGCADGEACDDGDACTERDVCIGGACAGTPFECEGHRPVPDASAPDDAGPRPLDDDAGSEPSERASGAEGCGCRAPGGAPRPTSVPALLLLAGISLVIRARAGRARTP